MSADLIAAGLIGDVIHEDNIRHLNPRLPAAPADGQHEGRGRCNFCGAYNGSTEWEKPCKGAWAESSKMRSHAHQKWMEDRLLEGGPRRKIAVLSTREIVACRLPGIQFGSTEQHFVQLECGHEREIGYLAKEAIHWGHVLHAACVDTTCPMTSREQHAVLNPHWREPLANLAEALAVLEGE